MYSITYYTDKQNYLAFAQDFAAIVSGQLNMTEQAEFDKINFELVEEFEDLTNKVESIQHLKDIFEEILEEFDITVSDLFPIHFHEDYAVQNHHFASISYEEGMDALFMLLTAGYVRDVEELRDEFEIDHHIEYENFDLFSFYESEIDDYLISHNIDRQFDFSSETSDRRVHIDFKFN